MSQGLLTAISCRGSMLWSQFPSIFTNFLRKNWCFSRKPTLWSKCFHNLDFFRVQDTIFSQFVWRKYF
jgi:hypothetical protein